MVYSAEVPMARLDATAFRDRVMVLRLRGELNRANAALVRTALRAVIDAAADAGPDGHARIPWPPLVVLDLSELRVLSVAGLAVLARTVEHCAGRGFASRLDVPRSGLVRRVVDVSRIAERVPVASTARADHADCTAPADRGDPADHAVPAPRDPPGDPARRDGAYAGVLDPETGHVWLPLPGAAGADRIVSPVADDE